MQKRMGDAFSWAGLCALSFLTVYFFAAGTTPLRPNEYLWDSALFQVVGKLWADGLTPYVDIFDHKGPLLFFVQKLAYETAHPRMMLYHLESLMVTASLVLSYQTLRLKWKKMFSFAGAVLMLVFWLPLMEYGNLCETHSMPWLMLSLYLALRYLHSGKQAHPPISAFAYGVCFGANVMIRPNNGVLIVAVALAITIRLLALRQWENIVQNAAALLGGLAAVIAPFVLFFWQKGAMDAFVYATWTFNLLYAASLEFLLDAQSLRNVLFFIIPSIWCLGLGGLCAVFKKGTLAGILLLSAVGTLYVTLGGIGYSHYFMLHVPLIALALYATGVFWQKRSKGRWALAALCVAFVLTVGKTALPYMQKNLLHAPSMAEVQQEAAYDQMVSDIVRCIPADERNRVAVCGLLVTDAELFLKSDLHPVGRYCFLMEWHSRADNTVRQRYLNTLKSGEAKWLIYREGGAGEEILSFIQEAFECQGTYTWQDGVYQLYRWKE